jgi:hypothetical protein
VVSAFDCCSDTTWVRMPSRVMLGPASLPYRQTMESTLGSFAAVVGTVESVRPSLTPRFENVGRALLTETAPTTLVQQAGSSKRSV